MMPAPSYQIRPRREHRIAIRDSPGSIVRVLAPWLVSCLTLWLATCCQAAQPLVLEGHSNVVSAIAFSPDGTRLISGSWDKSVRVWGIGSTQADQQAAAARQTNEVFEGHRDWVLAVAASEDGDVISASPRAVFRWNSARPKEPDVYPGLGGATVNAVALSADGKLLATGGRDGRVQVWRVGEPRPRMVFHGFESWVSCLGINTRHQALACGTRTGQIRLFNLAREQATHQLTGHADGQLLALAINPAGDTLATGGIDQTARIWDLATGEETAALAGHRGVVTAVAWSSDGKLLATGERHGAIKVWSPREGNRLLATLPGHTDDRLGFTVTTLAFGPLAARLASGSYDHRIKVWTVPD